LALILHITDLHLYAGSGHRLKGLDTQASFAAVLAMARAEFPHPDAIILGGDLAQDELPATYAMLANLLSDWPVPYMVTPGNHANLEAMQADLFPVLKGFSDCPRELHAGNWQLLALNSHAPGQVGGVLETDELARLDAQLAASDAAHALIALHHPPLPVGSAWMDRIALFNADAFWQVVQRHAQVRVCINGHIHQQFEAMHGPVQVLGTPSTCIQFKPQCRDFELDALSPGYRWLDLQDDGSVRSGIRRVQGFLSADLNDNSSY